MFNIKYILKKIKSKIIFLYSNINLTFFLNYDNLKKKLSIKVHELLAFFKYISKKFKNASLFEKCKYIICLIIILFTFSLILLFLSKLVWFVFLKCFRYLSSMRATDSDRKKRGTQKIHQYKVNSVHDVDYQMDMENRRMDQEKRSKDFKAAKAAEEAAKAAAKSARAAEAAAHEAFVMGLMADFFDRFNISQVERNSFWVKYNDLEKNIIDSFGSTDSIYIFKMFIDDYINSYYRKEQAKVECLEFLYNFYDRFYSYGITGNFFKPQKEDFQSEQSYNNAYENYNYIKFNLNKNKSYTFVNFLKNFFYALNFLFGVHKLQNFLDFLKVNNQQSNDFRLRFFKFKNMNLKNVDLDFNLFILKNLEQRNSNEINIIWKYITPSLHSINLSHYDLINKVKVDIADNSDVLDVVVDVLDLGLKFLEPSMVVVDLICENHTGYDSKQLMNGVEGIIKELTEVKKPKK
jgi:hypothetical protein